MRRIRDRQPQRLFRGGELARLITMVVMLGVIFMLIGHAREPGNWTFFAGRVEDQNDNFTLADIKRAEARRTVKARQASLVQAAKDPEAAEAAREKKPEPAAGDAKQAAPAEQAADQPAAVDKPASSEKGVSTEKPASTDKPTESNTEVSTSPKAPAAESTGDKPKPSDLPGADVPPIESADGELVRAPKPAPTPAEATPAETTPAEPAPAAAQPAGVPPSAPDVNQPQAAEKPAEPATKDGRQYDPEPLDEDPEQLEMIREEFQAVSDKAPVAPEEMAAYWRLMRWVYGQTTSDLAKRARKDVMFTHLWQKPDKYRGELIKLRLHLRRTISDDTDENLPGVDRIYESWGWTDEARQQFYIAVYSDLPSPDMPLGPDIMEEATFYGYFLKLMSYKAQDGKSRAAPLLIGRLVWHPTAKPVNNKRDEWRYSLWFFGALAALFALRFLVKLIRPSKPKPAIAYGVRLNDEGEEVQSLDEFLQDAEEPITSTDEQGEPESNGHARVDAQRNGDTLRHRRFSSGLDPSEDPDK